MIPSRCQLYPFPPIGVGTAEGESLTSYLNRLSWSYRVSPRALVEQELLPHLRRPHYTQSSPRRLPGFFRKGAIYLNGAGEMAQEWATILEQLTCRSDLQDLTLRPWAQALPSMGLLRPTPAWCPECYQQWREQRQTLYQPLLWMLQAVTFCPRHHRPLVVQCPHCQRAQSSLTVKQLQPGTCTQCANWLGVASELRADIEVDDEVLHWQQWVWSTLEELRHRSTSPGGLLWNRLPLGLAMCVKVAGGVRRLARRAEIKHHLLLHWISNKTTPSFTSLLKLCYALDLSPLDLLSADSTVIGKALQTRQVRPAQLRRPPSRLLNRQQALEVIQAVLDGREEPLCLAQIEHRLGLGAGILAYNFPEESTLVVAQYRAYSAQRAGQRVKQERDEVRQVTFDLYAEGTEPVYEQLRIRLSDPNIMRRPYARKAWHAARRELGIET